MLARSATNAQAVVKPNPWPGVLVRFGQGRGNCLIRRSPGRNWLGQSGPGPEWSPAQLSALPLTCGSETRQLGSEHAGGLARRRLSSDTAAGMIPANSPMGCLEK